MTPTHRHAAIALAIRLGLLWQATLSVAMLWHYARHGTSFYLTNVAGAWPYVHQHALWVGAFAALCLGSRPLARILAAGASLLAVVGVVSLAVGGDHIRAVFAALGVTSIGVVPALALLVVPLRSTDQRRMDWLVAAGMAAVVLFLCSDGVTQVSSDGMRMGSPQSSPVVRAVSLGWLACILILAWQGRPRPLARSAALLSTCHMFAIQLVWLVGEVASRADVAGLRLQFQLPLDPIVRAALLACLLTVLALSSRHPGRPPSANSVGGR